MPIGPANAHWLSNATLSIIILIFIILAVKLSQQRIAQQKMISSPALAFIYNKKFDAKLFLEVYSGMQIVQQQQ